MEKDKKGRFIKGTNGHSFEGFGLWYDVKEYPTIWLDGKSVKIHVFVWERVNGRKPKGFDIHHIDFNKKNYHLGNLELLSKSDHAKLHAGWSRKNGVWILKPCKDCQNLLPLDDFYQRKGLTPSNRCIKCSSIYFKELGKNPGFREKRRVYMKNYYKNRKEVASG